MVTDSKKLVLLQANENIMEEKILLNDLPTNANGLKISDDGVYVVVYEIKDVNGLIFNLKTKETTFQFQVTVIGCYLKLILYKRSNYHCNHSSFPVAFFQYKDKTLFIASTHYNYLEVYDPETGEPLRKRDGKIFNIILLIFFIIIILFLLFFYCFFIVLFLLLLFFWFIF